MNKITLGLIYGGKSCEHEVSISTAFSIFQNIDFSKYEVFLIYIDNDGNWHKIIKMNEPLLTLEEFSLSNSQNMTDVFKLKDVLDIVLPLVHGKNGEDGTLQGLLEIVNIPYVGSGILGSSVGMDKIMMKKVFDGCNIPQCKYLSFSKHDVNDFSFEICERVRTYLSYPCFVKPSNSGSSVGISKVKNDDELIKGIEFALKHDDRILIEEEVLGKELEIGILGNEPFYTSSIGEVITTNDFYDYNAKYKDKDATSIQVPANIPDVVSSKIEKVSKKVCKELNCYGLARVDFFWSEMDNTIYVNEINTIPGFTPYSMYPTLFKDKGISYSELIDRLISDTLKSYKIDFLNSN